MKSEVLKQIDGYPDYWVSTIGNVYSTKRDRMKKLNSFKDKYGYLRVDLCKNGERKTFKIHRLVAEAFIPNTENLPQVNHKNEDKTDNSVCNLEWCTDEYNSNYGSRNQRVSQTKTNGKSSKAVGQYTLDGTFIREWPSTMEVQRQTGWSQGNISSCCNGIRKTAHGYVWCYKV